MNQKHDIEKVKALFANAGSDNFDRKHPSSRGCTEQNFVGTYYLLGTPYPDSNNARVVVEARMYCTSGGTVYCRCWYHLPDGWGYGVSHVGGYGYDKLSSAFYAAFKDALCRKPEDNPELNEAIPDFYPGTGMEHCLEALKNALEELTGEKLYRLVSGA